MVTLPAIELEQHLQILDLEMTPEFASLLQGFMGGAQGLKGAMKAMGLYQYYRKPNKEVTLSSAFGPDMMRYMMEGWIPLTKYGRLKLTQRSHEHRLEYLFQRHGEGELTRDQIIGEGLHKGKIRVPGCNMFVEQAESYEFQARRMREEIRQNPMHHHDAQCFEEGWDVYFPQLELNPPDADIHCPYCLEPYNTPKAREQHVSVMHRDRLSAYATAEALASALDRREARSD